MLSLTWSTFQHWRTSVPITARWCGVSSFVLATGGGAGGGV